MANNIEVARATVTIIPTMEGAQASITSQLSGVADSSAVASAGEKTGSKLASGIAKGLGAATAVGAAVTALTAKAASAFVDSASSVAQYGDNIDKMSQKMGISSTAYQEWDFVMQHCGTSMETLKSSMKTLANAAETNSDAFEALGISQEQLSSMSQEELFSATITALQNVESETERTYLAGKTLGKGATELGALLNMSADETADMKQQLHDLGGVMSEDAVSSAAAYQDALQNMQTAASGVKNRMLAEFLPGMTSAMDGIAAVFSGDSSGMTKVKEGIMSMVDTVKNVLPEFLQMGSEIITTLLEGFAPMIPTLLEAVAGAFAQVISTLTSILPELIPVIVDGIGIVIQALLDNLPAILSAVVELFMAVIDKLTDASSLDSLIETAITLITTLAQGLIDAIPKLIPAIPKIIGQLVVSLVSHIPDIVAAALQLMGGLVTGLLQSIPDVIKGAWEVVTSLIETIMEFPKKIIEAAKQWGKDMIDNFVGGIKGCINKVGDAVSSVADKIKGFLGFSEPEEGPLSNFHTYAPDMIDLFTEGLKDSESKLTGTLNTVLSLPDATIKDVGNSGSITIPIYLGDEMLDTVLVSANQRINLMSGGVA